MHIYDGRCGLTVRKGFVYFLLSCLAAKTALDKDNEVAKASTSRAL